LSSWWPLRLTQQAQALVDLLPPGLAQGEFAHGGVVSQR
jgi:hypothetical protein